MTGSTTAQASCGLVGPPQTLTATLAASHVAFVGSVVYTTDNNRFARVKVESIWKGPRLPTYVDVRGEAPGSGPFSGSESDHQYQAGQRFLFFPLNDQPPFQDYGDCNSSALPYSQAIAAYAPADAKSPEPATPVDEIGTFVGRFGWAGGAGVLVLAVISLVLLTRRRRPRSAHL